MFLKFRILPEIFKCKVVYKQFSWFLIMILLKYYMIFVYYNINNTWNSQEMKLFTHWSEKSMTWFVSQLIRLFYRQKL